MSAKTKIEWTDSTWNPVRGCTRLSQGCTHCYAEYMSARNLPGLRSPTTGQPFAIITPSGPRWTGRVELIESQLEIPLHWRKPRRIFVNSMSDTFHEALPEMSIDRIFAVMALCPWHTFMVLTKRAERRREYIARCARIQMPNSDPVWEDFTDATRWLYRRSWPLPNVRFGVSVEDCANKRRIDQLRETPAALRFLSLEPLLEDLGELDLRGIGWVIVGGESGPGARPCDVAWIRSIIRQCRDAAVPCFVKQLGAHAIDMIPNRHGDLTFRFTGAGNKPWGKGGDPAEWPTDLRVREMPEVPPCRRLLTTSPACVRRRLSSSRRATKPTSPARSSRSCLSRRNCRCGGG